MSQRTKEIVIVCVAGLAMLAVAVMVVKWVTEWFYWGG
jgi:hypothetical protein